MLRGFAARAAVWDGWTSGLLAAGVVLCGLSLALAVVVERRGDGLVRPPGVRLPQPSSGVPLLLVGLCALVAGAYASPAFLGVGAVLLVAAALRLARELRPAPAGPDRRTVLAARRIRAFAAGAPVRCAVQHTGRGNVRLLLVSASGALGDVVVNGPGRAEQAVALAGGELVDSASRELGAAIRTGPYEWRRMAGQQLRPANPPPG